MALLLFIIWTYFLQFETTATINLKNTHFFFVNIFVLIALRALRFEPIWVVLSGLTGAIGWCIIVWNTFYNATMHVVTWDYVTYASTRSVYFGAEFDKVLSILLVTGIIAIVLYRAQETLYNAVIQTEAAKDLSRFFDMGVAKKITQSPALLQSGYGEVRQAAIMFTDLRGFTKASATLSPTELITLLGEYQSLLVPIIQKHNGTIDKFMGDGIMVSFGAVIPSKTYAADALYAADHLIAAVANWNVTRNEKNKLTFEVGLGLAIGEVVFGVIGDKQRLEYTVIGEPANLAAKLEKQNKIEHTHALTTVLTLNEALKQGYVETSKKEKRPAQIVAGVAEAVDLVVLA